MVSKKLQQTEKNHKQNLRVCAPKMVKTTKQNYFRKKKNKKLKLKVIEDATD